jgi:uncharacterized DUF497 family protein
MEFEADPAKAAQNLKKHKVGFEEAASIFGDPFAYTFPDPDHSFSEHRWLTFGMSKFGRVLAVAYTRTSRQGAFNQRTNCDEARTECL